MIIFFLKRENLHKFTFHSISIAHAQLNNKIFFFIVGKIFMQYINKFVRTVIFFLLVSDL